MPLLHIGADVVLDGEVGFVAGLPWLFCLGAYLFAIDDEPADKEVDFFFFVYHRRACQLVSRAAFGA